MIIDNQIASAASLETVETGLQIPSVHMTKITE